MPHPQHQTQQPPVELKMFHDWESDTLFLGNGGPIPGGMELSPLCLIYFGPQCENANAFAFELAKELLLPILQGQVTGEVRYESPDDDAVMTYNPETDTLRLRNGRLDGERKDIFPGCSVFMEDARGLVSSLTLERAAELLLPVLTAEPEEDGD